MEGHMTSALTVAQGTTPTTAVTLAGNMLDTANLVLLDMLSGGHFEVDEQRALYGVLYATECAEKLVDHANGILRRQEDGPTPQGTSIGSVLADAYERGTADMAVIEGFLRAHRVSGLDIDPASLRTSDDAKLREMWGVK